ncbi:DUF2147 domain-containing protein [Tenacibaculum sp. S7007]|uniref:DUF2147 domain-containing protein n=1 Tax=Tenacibaculum pelagium TaxID=2759527 RepID=A0A839ASK3_9FLAO|nr:DUF2147 domain-containing protein [Tenacibaculum pelagium]MBA6157318.1 DUF2147 domain-containing protein [Tenacibaculum pelagium]
MKKTLLSLIVLLTACSTQIDKQVLGTWNVQSNFYKATYKIEKQGKKLIGKVLYYNDDTTVLHETKTDKDIFLHDLKYKNEVYVDAISGATNTVSEKLTIKVKHKDTLEVTSYINKKPLIENWTRKQ